MRGTILTITAVLFVVACSESDDTVAITVEGRALTPQSIEGGVAGVVVTSVDSGDSVVTDSNGNFVLDTRVSKPVSPNLTTKAVIRFDSEGYVPVFKTVQVTVGHTATVVATVHKQIQTLDIDIPTTRTTTTTETQNAAFTFANDSILDVNDSAVTGLVTVKAASWNATLPYKPENTPPQIDSRWMPVASDIVTLGGESPYLRVIAGAYLEPSPNFVAPDQGVELALTATYADLTVGTLDDDDVRVFRIDENTGAMVEQTPGTFAGKNRLVAKIDATGTWVWARESDEYSCVTVTVTKGDLAAPGAMVRLVTDAEDQPFFDEKIGAGEDGTWCLRGNPGTMLRTQTFLSIAGQTTLIEKPVLMGGTGTCGACPKTLEVVFPCTNADDCLDGATCTEGECVAPAEEVQTLE